ncbi:hypothetical protein Roomu2_00040 [Pseudomonas phage vB_PpuM-Roomu-2]|uniref:Uncharacterized protein n=1 Tax=Pseudomonas phage vB_PpuM-Roomu-2 TaxID=3132621 RepID=A0AAX4MZ27_9CAUD
MIPSNFATKRLTELAQKLYDDHLNISNVVVYAVDKFESVVAIFDKQNRPDKYWVQHQDTDESKWTWVREYNGA